jgi:hypothetical protein
MSADIGIFYSTTRPMRGSRRTRSRRINQSSVDDQLLSRHRARPRREEEQHCVGEVGERVVHHGMHWPPAFRESLVEETCDRRFIGDIGLDRHDARPEPLDEHTPCVRPSVLAAAGRAQQTCAR